MNKTFFDIMIENPEKWWSIRELNEKLNPRINLSTKLNKNSIFLDFDYERTENHIKRLYRLKRKYWKNNEESP